MNTVTRFGLDLAKNSFAVCGVDRHEHIVVQKALKRAQALEYSVNRPSAIVAMEAGSGAHYWARELVGLGHDARIIAPSPCRVRWVLSAFCRFEMSGFCRHELTS